MTSVTGRPAPARHAGAGTEGWLAPGARGASQAPAPSRSAQPSVPGTSRRPSPGKFSANTVLAVIGLGALAVVILWWHTTPDVSGLGGWLTGAGEILGLLAGYGVVVLVALMARLPPLERGVGTDRLARWHAMGGRYIVSADRGARPAHHLGLRGEAHTSVVSETGVLLTEYPDVLMATVAGFLLLGVGVVSMRAARRRLGYETWYYLHLYTYLAIALAFSHQFAVGAAVRQQTLAARFGWSAVYLTVGGAHALVPARGPGAARSPGTASVVIGVERERRRASSRSTSAARIWSELDAEPGQFFRWRFLTRALWWSVAPVFAVRRAGQGRAADHGQGPRRPQRGARSACDRVPA